MKFLLPLLTQIFKLTKWISKTTKSTKSTFQSGESFDVVKLAGSAVVAVSLDLIYKVGPSFGNLILLGIGCAVRIASRIKFK